MLSGDPELVALKKLTVLLRELEPESQRRIVKYAYDRWCGASPAEKQRPALPGEANGQQADAG